MNRRRILALASTMLCSLVGAGTASGSSGRPALFKGRKGCPVCGGADVVAARSRVAETPPRNGWATYVAVGTLYYHESGRVCDRPLRDVVEREQRVSSTRIMPRAAGASPRYNGGTLCDMGRGPCACGAWH